MVAKHFVIVKYVISTDKQGDCSSVTLTLKLPSCKLASSAYISKGCSSKFLTENMGRILM